MLASGGPRPPRATLTQLFFDAAERHDLPNAYQMKRDGRYVAISHDEVLRRVRHIALGLAAVGVERGARVGIMSENRPEWALADWACLCSGVTDVPIYPTLPAEQIVHPLNDSGAVALFVSTPEQASKAASVRTRLAQVRTIICFADPKPEGADMTLAELEATGAALDSPAKSAEFKAAALGVQPDDLATLIYTSGTTGIPKGVMLSHDNIASNVMASRKKVPVTPGDVALSFLPLSHVFERMGDYLFYSMGVSIAYAESIDTVPVDLIAVRPMYCMAVPRLFEKMYARVVEQGVSGGALRARIFHWAVDVADRWADERLAGREPGGLLAWQYGVAQRFVFSKLKARTGGRLKYFVSGGAPLAPSINKFFFAAGLTILEGYGLTETSPVISVNSADAFRIGSVGRPVEGVDVMIADDGEILTRGPHVMQGYYNLPEATAEAIDANGWLHTGDIGVLEDGFLRITDRKKEIIVTAGGKNIAPQPIENRIKTNPFVSRAVMVGNRRKFPSVLVVPDWATLEQWATTHGIAWTERAQLLAMPTVQAKMDEEVRSTLVGLASFERPKRIGLLEHEFSIERGELTPKLSVKRAVVEQRHGALIDSLYADAD